VSLLQTPRFSSQEVNVSELPDNQFPVSHNILGHKNHKQHGTTLMNCCWRYTNVGDLLTKGDRERTRETDKPPAIPRSIEEVAWLMRGVVVVWFKITIAIKHEWFPAKKNHTERANGHDGTIFRALSSVNILDDSP
jgi:hypothetical protein